MIDALFLLSVICGCVAALRGNRTAAALLIATAVGSLMTLSGIDFNAYVWITIDLGVICVALGPKMNYADMAVAVLFVPIWSLYTVDGWAAYYAVSLLTSAQFIVTFPFTDVLGRVLRTIRNAQRPGNELKLTT